MLDALTDAVVRGLVAGAVGFGALISFCGLTIFAVSFGTFIGWVCVTLFGDGDADE